MVGMDDVLTKQVNDFIKSLLDEDNGRAIVQRWANLEGLPPGTPEFEAALAAFAS